ncbi:MAG TPA: efflux RND transporter periplasmic adaptor subunit [Longimicrobiales bacterium]|nr:efflux RND transporter periplasmic adaptor subunit [Longimicrobiales bacterium]
MESLRWVRGGIALLVTGALVACGNAEADDTTAESDEFVRVINVEVMEITTQPFVDEIRLTGAVSANQDVQVSAEESGVIKQVMAEKGARLRAGDPLARIDGAVLTAQVEQARAQSELASQTWDRRKRLWEEDRVGSEIAYLEAKYLAEQTAANLRVLEERLARTTIRAPFAGILEERMIEVGTMVGPGQVVGRVVDLDPVKIVAGVPERYAADVRRGAEVQVTFDVFPGVVYTAPVTYVGSTVNAQNRTFSVEVVMPNPQGLIKPEMVANVSLARRDLAEAVVVPQDALVRVEIGYVVFVAVERDGGTVAESRPVVLGPSRRNMVVVESGLEPGERIVVVGQKSVAAGDRLNVVGTR